MLETHEIQASAPVDHRYAIGLDCTWAGPIGDAAVKKSRYLQDTMAHFCPGCGGDVSFMNSAEDFWAKVAEGEKRSKGYEHMMRWAAGRCYPDMDTLINAYRQAMEE